MTKTADDHQNSKQSDPPMQAGSATPPSSAKSPSTSHVAQNATASVEDLPADRPPEHGGQAGLEPTRFGDWEKRGRCTDF